MDNDGGLPVIKLVDINYKGPELHVPLHNYLGPGTNVAKRVASLNLPINHSDAVALVHDIEYYGLPETIADNNAIHNAKGLTKSAMLIAFKIKDLFGGMKPTKNLQLYEDMKNFVMTNPLFKNKLEQYDVHFYEEFVPNYSKMDSDQQIHLFDSSDRELDSNTLILDNDHFDFDKFIDSKSYSKSFIFPSN